MSRISNLFPLILLLILSTLSFANTSSVIDVKISKSPNDKRQYDALTLDNKLRVLLISDPTTDKSAASLDVNIGSADDPSEYEGLAHFLEHMLFLGTKKYPEPDAYQKYINQHGGSHNAYTSLENTNYFFDIQPDYFEEALNRFSEQFTHPLFNEEYVEREVNAVHSEYTSKVKDDGRRFFSVLKEAFATEHPYNSFSVGNLETLKEKDGQSLRETLLDFYHQHYSANQMTLVILGKEPLPQLKKWAVSKFSSIPNHDRQSKNISTDFFEPGFLPAKLEIESVMDKRSMMIAFPIQSSSLYPYSQPISYLANLIGHEGKGSLLSTLKQERLVDSLSAGSEFDTQLKEMFLIRMSLTADGLAQQQKILEIVFSYLKILKAEGIKKRYFDEQATMLRIGFDYQEKSEPIHYVGALSRALHTTEPNELLIKPYALKKFNPDLYKNYLNALTPDNMLVTINANSIQGNNSTKWYDTPFNIIKFDESKLSRLYNPPTFSSLSLPEPNIFIPEKTNLLSTEINSKPELLLKADGLELWHHSDASFGTPKSNLFLTIRSPETVKSPQSLNMTEILVALLKDALNEFSYPAYLAGLHYELYNHMRGITIKISGYSDRQSILLSKVINSLKFQSFTHERFDIIKERLSRKLNNAKDRKPFQQAISKAQNLLITPSWSEQERIAALASLELKDVELFRSSFLSKLDIAILSSGNTSRATSLNISQLVSTLLLDSATTTSVSRAKIIKLPSNQHKLARFSIEHNDTGFIHYVQGANTSYKERAQLMLLSQIISSDYYNQLRTEKQLGYIVFATSFELLEVPGLAFIVQSPNTPGDALQQETNDFLSEALTIVEELDANNLSNHKNAVISKLTKSDNTLYERTNRFWKDIDVSNVSFDTEKQLSKEVEKLSRHDLVTLIQRINANTNGTLTIFTLPPTDEAEGAQPTLDDDELNDLAKILNETF